MAKTYSDVFADLKQSVKILPLDQMKAKFDARDKQPITLVDVREKEEFRAGYIPGAVHIARAYLEQQAEQKLPNKNAEIIVYCASGNRSLFAAKTLQEFVAWAKARPNGISIGSPGPGTQMRMAAGSTLIFRCLALGRSPPSSS